MVSILKYEKWPAQEITPDGPHHTGSRDTSSVVVPSVIGCFGLFTYNTPSSGAGPPQADQTKQLKEYNDKCSKIECRPSLLHINITLTSNKMIACRLIVSKI